MNAPAAPSPTRDQLIQTFLTQYGWLDVVREPIPGDASFRRYERIRHRNGSAILMDAPPDREDVKPFVAVATYLVGCGFHAPRILAQDTLNGFLLLEDLGDSLFSRVLNATDEDMRAEQEKTFYLAATDVLANLYSVNQKQGVPALPPYDLALLMREVELFSDWFLPAIFGAQPDVTIKESFIAAWKNTLRKLPKLMPVVVMRDYHADNLLWLKNGAVGLLDFQDAVIGSPAYDMVSFLEDARRDVLPETVTLCMERFLEKTGVDRVSFETAYAILGAQRNTKIIGIFTRLGKRDAKYRYQQYLPRVWQHLRHDLTHPALSEVSVWVKAHIPSEWQLGTPPFPDNI